MALPNSINKTHISSLYLLCFTSIWERFAFYAMRSILVLYMTKIFLFSNEHAYSIFAAFTALLYLTPFVGGHLADKFLGTKNAIFLGGIILSIGYLLLAATGQMYFYLGLSIIIIGNGFFMPNIANAVGDIYQKNDAHREGGFSLFYSATNLGAFIPPLISAWIIFQFGWQMVFVIASIIVLSGTFIFYLGLSSSNISEKIYTSSKNFKTKLFWLLVGVIFFVFLFSELIKNTSVANSILFTISSGFIFYSIKKSFSLTKIERHRLLVIYLLTAFSILFWVLAEQAAMSLTIYTEYNVQRNVFGLTIPTEMFLSLNPFFIIICGPILSKVWIELAKKKLNPSVPAKFAMGTLLMGIGFIILPAAISTQSSIGQINWAWIVLSYFLQSIGELLIAPIGLSMITELSPKQMVGLMMGCWYFATAVANCLAGFAAQLTSLSSNTNEPLITSLIYGHVFNLLGSVAVVAGVIVFLCAPLLKKII